jgi:hypothetical protein
VFEYWSIGVSECWVRLKHGGNGFCPEGGYRTQPKVLTLGNIQTNGSP